MNIDLLCVENRENETKAYEDPILLQERVFQDLLKFAEVLVAQYGHLSLQAQTEVNADMRKIVAEWMMEVCEEQKCQDEVFLMAIQFMDRFLSVCGIKKNMLQCLGTACMFIASKLREPQPLAASTLVYYTDHSISVKQLLSWELLVLQKLKWNLAAVTPQDFTKHLLRKLPVQDVGISYEMVNKHAKTLITLCAREYKFSAYDPSRIACACLVSALGGLNWEQKSGRTLQSLIKDLADITSTEEDYIRYTFLEVEEMVRKCCEEPKSEVSEENETAIRPNEFTPPPGKFEHTTALTPTDVHDVHF